MTGRIKSGAVIAFFITLLVALSVTLALLAKEHADHRLLEADAYELISQNPVPTIVCVDNKIVLWNRAMEFVSGRSSAEMVGQETVLMVPDDLKERHEQAVARVSQAPGFDRDERFLILPIETQFANEPIPVASTVCHIRRFDGTVVMIARLEGIVMHPNIRWMDVTNREYSRVQIRIVPEKKDPPSEPVKTEKEKE